MTAAVILARPDVVLPVPDYAPPPAPRTLELVADRWPHVEALAAQERGVEIVAALEDLAAAMRAATARDAPLYRDALIRARLVAYADIAHAGHLQGAADAARAALRRCAAADPDARAYIEELLAR